MNIIVEGPDNSGKSTLVECIAKVLNWPIVTSPGPTRTREELNERARHCVARDRVIFDRHCIVSEGIYGMMRGNVMTDPELEAAFYYSSQIIVYCRAEFPSLKDHVVKAHDTPDHLMLLARKQTEIIVAYDEWALRRASIIYRKGEPPTRVVRFIMGELRS